jgi:hypothetical protein
MSALQIRAWTVAPVTILLTRSNVLVRWALRALDVKLISMIASHRHAEMVEVVMMLSLVIRANVLLVFQVRIFLSFH